jgi:hypothetical protein
MGTSTMTSSHVSVASGDRSGGAQLTVLAVHVVGSGSRVISEPDAEVLHSSWGSLRDLPKPNNIDIKINYAFRRTF